jgi:hypothetical protein
MPAALLVGEELCSTHSDAAFEAVRSALGVPHDFLCSFNWAALRAGGGKGGTLLAFHSHRGRSYVVKELSPSDHATLLGLAGPYCVHATSANRGSLLAPLYAHFRRHETGVDYLAMGSVLLPPPAEVVAAAQPCLYDLKGTADDKTLMYEGEKVLDVHKRFYNIGLRLCDFLSRRCRCCGRAAASAADLWAPGRREYAQGKKHAREVVFPVTPLSCAWLLDRLEVRTRAASTRLTEREMPLSMLAISIPQSVTHAGRSQRSPASAPMQNSSHANLRWPQVDVSFLREHGLMDYSMLVRTHRIPPVGSVPPNAQPVVAAAHQFIRIAAEARASEQREGGLDLPLACEVADGSVWLVDVGLIDYLQVRTMRSVPRTPHTASKPLPPLRHDGAFAVPL